MVKYIIERTISEHRKVIDRVHLLHERLDTDPIRHVSDFLYSSKLCDKNESKFDTYLRVPSVAIPFSTGSGVLVRSCDASLGAILVAQLCKVLLSNYYDDKIVMWNIVDGFVPERL